MKLLKDLMFNSGMLFMPDMGSAPQKVTNNRVSASFVGASGERTTTIGGDYIGEGLTQAEVDAWANAIGQLSNAGLYKVSALGSTTEIALANAIIMDEMHGIERSLVLVFQHEATLDVARFKVPAPGAELFVGRYQMKSLNDATQGARLTLAVNGYLGIINDDTADPGNDWVFVNGYLDNAPSELRKVLPPDENYIEPPTGTPADGPGDTPA